MFGRKGMQQPQSGAPAEAPVRAPIVVETLAQCGEVQGHTATIEFAQSAGEFFFELLYQQMVSASDPGDPVGLENFVGLLASAGGVACIATAMCEYEVIKSRDPNPNLLLEQKIDEHSYFIGDLPSRYLYESECSLLNIALPWAMKNGANIEHDFLHEPVQHVMQSAGTPQFGIPRLPAEHMPNALPIDLAECAWPQAETAFEKMGLAVEWRPAAIGFAIGKAIDTGAQTIDPMILATIAVECAVPMAAIDPSRFMDRLNEIKAA